MTLTKESTAGKGFTVRSRDTPSGVADTAQSPIHARISNTGLSVQSDNSLELGIDYLTFVLPIKDSIAVHSLADTLSSRYLDAFEFRVGQGRFVGRQFANWAVSSTGMLMLWNLPGENLDKGSVRIAISGKSLERATVLETQLLISQLIQLNGVCNRIDIKVDDFSRSMNPENIIDAIHHKNYSGFRKGKVQEDISGSVYDRGWTIYMGSRESDKMIRYYNAKPVHKIDAFRYEIEYKNAMANEIATVIAMMNTNETLTEMLSAIIVKSVDFIERSEGKQAVRCSRLPFWQKWIDRFGTDGIKLSPPRKTPTLSRSIAWVERSVSATLAMICKYVGGDKVAYLKGLIQAGEEKFGARHEAILKACKKEVIREYPVENGYVYDMTPPWEFQFAQA
jgi:Replication initiation factor